MNPTISTSTLSQLSPLDVHALYKLRVDVFVHEQQCPYAEIDNTDALPTTVHILARESQSPHSQLLGCARLYPARREGEDVIQFGRFAIAQHGRGSGLGRQIVEAAVDFVSRTYPGTPMYLEAQSPLVNYYGTFGFIQCGREFEDEGVPHTPMIRRGKPLVG